jgi:nitroreductase
MLQTKLTVFETILARRSVRNYKDWAVDNGIVRTLLEAAVHAPTAIHQEAWGFIIIQEKKILKYLSDCAKPLFVKESNQRNIQHTGHMLETFSQPEFNIFYNASTLILICGEANASYFTADCWLAAQNLMLAACAMGLGTCVIGSAVPAFNLNEVRSKLSIPDAFSVVAPIILGYPVDETLPAIRKKPNILANITTKTSQS